MGLFSTPDPGEDLVELAEKNQLAVKDHLPTVSDLMKHQDSQARINGTYALARLSEVDTGAARTLLIECALLLDDNTSDIRKYAIYTMKQVASDYPDEVDEYTEDLIDVLQTDSSPTNRRGAAGALGDIGTPDCLMSLHNAKNNETDTEVRQEIFDVLSNVESDENKEKGSTEVEGTGILESCPECSTNFGRLNGIPRRCPGCGVSISKLL